MRHLIQFFLVLFLGLNGICFVGCGDSDSDSKDDKTSKTDKKDDDHDDDHPESYDEAVEQLAGLHAAIKLAAEDDISAAHGPLHSVGHLLEEIPELAEKEGFDAAQLTAIQAAATTMLDSYTEVDHLVHGREGTSYEELSAQLDEAMQTLKDKGASEDS